MLKEFFRSFGFGGSKNPESAGKSVTGIPTPEERLASTLAASTEARSRPVSPVEHQEVAQAWTGAGAARSEALKKERATPAAEVSTPAAEMSSQTPTSPFEAESLPGSGEWRKSHQNEPPEEGESLAAK